MKILHVTREQSADRRYGLGRATAPLVTGLRAFAQADYYCAADLTPAQHQAAARRARYLATLCPNTARPAIEALCQAWATGRAAAELARAEGYSHLHAHDVMVAAGVRSALAGAPLAWGYTQHGFHTLATALNDFVVPLPTWLRHALAWLERRTLRAADWAIFPSAAGRDHLAASLQLPADARWQVIPHARPDWALPARQLARAKLGWAAETRYLLAVGQLIALKRFDWIARAMRHASSDWRLVLLGDGDPTPYFEQADRLGIARPLVASTDTPADYYAAADAYASASSTESFGLANLEALCAGLPAVCTAVDAVPEAVGAGVDLARDEAEFDRLLAQLLQSPDVRERLHAKALAHASSWPTQAEITQRYLAVYAAADKRGRHAH